MAALPELLKSAPTPPLRQVLSKREHEPVDLAGVSDPDSGLDGSCTCGCFQPPLTAEAPLADVAPLTSESPIAEPPLTSEPSGTGAGADTPDI